MNVLTRAKVNSIADGTGSILLVAVAADIACAVTEAVGKVRVLAQARPILIVAAKLLSLGTNEHIIHALLLERCKL